MSPSLLPSSLVGANVFGNFELHVLLIYVYKYKLDQFQFVKCKWKIWKIASENCDNAFF